MFWGLIMEPKRRYTQTVQKAFHISKAALDLYNCDDEPTQLILTFNSRNYLLCTLQKDTILQCSLNLNFNVGDVICFATNGKSNVHLSGYLVEDEFEEDDELSESEDISALVGTKRKAAKSDQPTLKKSKTEKLLEEVDNYDSEDDTTFDIQEAEEDEDDDLDEEADEEDEDEEDEEEDNEEDESSLSETEAETTVEVVEKKTPVNGISPKANEKKKKKQKQKEQKQTELKQKEQKQKTVDKSPKPDTPSKASKSILKNATPEQVQGLQKRTVEGGVFIQDLKLGDGPIVKPGRMVQVYYEGRLKQNNKMFDSNTSGAGFKFRVGKQEVIKGWDVGLVGMKVGGKRRISCPPQMAYGQKGSPPVIPPNSTLVFEVEVKKVQ